MNKILQLGKFYPPTWGGIETVTHNLNLVLENSNYEVDTFVFGNEVEYNDDKICRFKYLQFFRTPISLPMFFSLFRKVNEYDYVIVHMPNPWAGLCLLLSGYKGKVILYWHAESKGPKILEKIVNFVDSLLIDRAFRILGATSEHIQQVPNSNEIKSKCAILPYPINEELIDVAVKSSKRKFDFSNEIRLLNVGRLVEYKGQILLLKAMNILRNNGINVKLTIVGDGPLYNNLSDYIHNNQLGEIVTIKSNLKHSELNKVFLDSDIFCFPSITEQEMYGMAQIEAYAYGLPAVVSNIPRSGVPEVATNSKSALLARYNDEQDLASKLQSLIYDISMMESFSERGKEYIKSFSYNRMQKEINKILSDLD